MASPISGGSSCGGATHVASPSNSASGGIKPGGAQGAPSPFGSLNGGGDGGKWPGHMSGTA